MKLSVDNQEKELDWDKDFQARQIYWHTTAHVLAQAVKRLYPEVKLGIGPPTKEGFYYDFDFQDKQITQEDLPKIEEVMKRIISEDLQISKFLLTKEEAKELLKKANESYKLELLEELIEEDKVSFYKQGEFVELCKGPHLTSTGIIKNFKLLSIAGAYWRGDERNKMLTRIYGISFPKASQLKEYLERLEEAKIRDHRKLGKELELFSFYEDIGPGLVVYHHQGAILRYILEDFSKREHLKRGYSFIISPHLGKLDLWEKSGHLKMEYPMYFAKIEDKEYGIKPMNCPFHIYVYKSKVRSYKELPLRFFELGTVYRAEKSGVLHGLLRVRGFTQDDAHIFCTDTQLAQEIEEILKFTYEILTKFGFFDYQVYLSTRPQKYIGDLKAWEIATSALKTTLEKLNINYQIDEEGGVFYGPKIDIKLKDVLDRLWQGPTIQVDFNLPSRFSLSYIDKDNTKKIPIMIHRAIFGSFERFIATLLEHYKGAFPTWLAPCQITIIPISKKNINYAKMIENKFKEYNLRVSLDDREETLSYKIMDNQHKKIPYIIIIGDKEEANNTLAIRYRGDKGQYVVDKKPLKREEFLNRILKEVQI
jgi:threonyl-tRNA synthetase